MNLLLIEPDEIAVAESVGRTVAVAESVGRTLSGPPVVSLSGPRAEHLRHVLNVTNGSTVRIGIVDGATGTGTVLSVTPEAVQLACVVDGSIPERPRVDLLLALPRPKVLRRLWAQLAAVGVGRILLTNAARVERNYFDTHLLSPDIYRPLLLEGLQQARDTRLPIVSVHKRLKVFVEDELDGLTAGLEPAYAKASAVRHSFSEGGTRPALRDCDRLETGPLRDRVVRIYADPGSETDVSEALASRDINRVLLAVGPEGGWTDYERRMLGTHGFVAVTIGPRTLRTDTACVALLSLIHAGVRLASVRTTN